MNNNMKRKIHILSYIILNLIIHISLTAQEIKPDFELAKNNTYSQLISRYYPAKALPCWLEDEKSFLFARLSDIKPAIYLTDIEKKEKRKLNCEIRKINNSISTFEYEENSYLLNRTTGIISQSVEKKNSGGVEAVSPDGNYKVTVKNYNLFLQGPAENGKNKQISFDGEKFFCFKANIDYNFTNEKFNKDTCSQPPNISWSPDSEYFIAMRTDARMLKDHWVINSISDPRPEITYYKQRHPGEPFPVDELWIYHVASDTFFQVNLRRWPNENYWFQGWSKKGNYFFVQRFRREQDKCDLLAIDREGRYRLLIEEDPGANIYKNEFLELSDEKYLWFSRKNGRGHLYLYDNEGKLTRQITKGEFNVEKVLKYNAEAEELFVLINGKDKGINPYFSFLYSVNIYDGSLKLLTPENANHEVWLSPDAEYFVDIYSRVDLPHKSVLRDKKGDLIMELANGETDNLIKNGWQNPEQFTVKAADNKTELWGVMWKPFNFDSHKKYPVITFVYPGPQDNFVPVQFFRRLNNAHLAQYGFIVVMCGTRGSSYKRSVKFSEYFRKNLRDYPLEDNKYMLEQLAERHSFVDINRVGIWGGSSGGFMAAAAILSYPDFYKVAVSRSGQHDPAVFHSWWSDIFNTPPGRDSADSLFSNISLAENLEGRLLLIHGETDMNVHPSNSARLANALMKAGKYFDYIVVPGSGHGWGPNREYIQKRIWLYFIEHLMGYKIEDMDIMRY